MKFFRRSGKAIKKWHKRALFVDLHKTRVTICKQTQRHVPPWIYRQMTRDEN